MESTTPLFRSVHPNHRKNNRLLSLAFLPNDNDEGLLSVYDSEQFTAEGSYRHRTEVMGKQSVGIWSVTVEEATGQELPSRLEEEGFYPGHAVIDFTAHDKKQQKIKASVLANIAEKKGCLHPAPPPVDPGTQAPAA